MIYFYPWYFIHVSSSIAATIIMNNSNYLYFYNWKSVCSHDHKSNTGSRVWSFRTRNTKKQTKKNNKKAKKQKNTLIICNYEDVIEKFTTYCIVQKTYQAQNQVESVFPKMFSQFQFICADLIKYATQVESLMWRRVLIYTIMTSSIKNQN